MRREHLIQGNSFTPDDPAFSSRAVFSHQRYA